MMRISFVVQLCKPIVQFVKITGGRRSLCTIANRNSAHIEEVDKKIWRSWRDEEWEDFKKKYNKKYATKEEEVKRRKLFLETYNRVKDRQLGGKVKVNFYADYTWEEMKVMCGRRPPKVFWKPPYQSTEGYFVTFVPDKCYNAFVNRVRTLIQRNKLENI